MNLIEGAGLVKIGRSVNPRARLRDLQVGSPVELKLLKTIRGGRASEIWLHLRFEAQHVRGEWFRPEGPLGEWIEKGCPL